MLTVVHLIIDASAVSRQEWSVEISTCHSSQSSRTAETPSTGFTSRYMTFSTLWLDLLHTPRLTQPCIPLGTLNWVPVLAAVKKGKERKGRVYIYSAFIQHLFIYQPGEEDERLSWPGWLTYNGQLTHISGHPSATGRRKNTGQRLTCYCWATKAGKWLLQSVRYMISRFEIFLRQVK